MINSYTITSAAWLEITSAGKSATCWMREDSNPDNNSDVRIYHTTAGAPLASVIDHGKKLWTQNSSNDVMVLSADNDNDIYYARCVSGTADIIVDEVG